MASTPRRLLPSPNWSTLSDVMKAPIETSNVSMGAFMTFYFTCTRYRTVPWAGTFALMAPLLVTTFFDHRSVTE